jgi:hypothetical protein
MRARAIPATLVAAAMVVGETMALRDRDGKLRMRLEARYLK